MVSVGVCQCVLLFWIPRCVGLAPPRAASASVMTEDQWLASTSCGTPGLVMCHQQRRLAGAMLPVGCFSCVCAG